MTEKEQTEFHGNLNEIVLCSVDSIGIKITPRTECDDDKRYVAELKKFYDDYFKVFAISTTDASKCINCGETLGGLFGSFSWGMVHGEGNCSCGWPCRAYHHAEGIVDGEKAGFTWNHILSYHPDFVDFPDQGARPEF